MKTIIMVMIAMQNGDKMKMQNMVIEVDTKHNFTRVIKSSEVATAISETYDLSLTLDRIRYCDRMKQLEEKVPECK